MSVSLFCFGVAADRLNESPSEKEGKCGPRRLDGPIISASMKALPKRKGNVSTRTGMPRRVQASMKALPKRKGNKITPGSRRQIVFSLNESPSEKEGKFAL